MGMAAILVLWSGPFEQNFVPPSYGDSIWNLAPISLGVSKEKMFKGVDDSQIDGRRTLSYKPTNVPSAKVS